MKKIFAIILQKRRALPLSARKTGKNFHFRVAPRGTGVRIFFAFHAKILCFFPRKMVKYCIMEYSYVRELDAFFCAQFSDYVRIAAIEGYKMPEMLTVGADGNILRRDPKLMRIAYQEDAQKVLANFKAGLADTEFTFRFRYPSLSERRKALFARRRTFSGLLPAVLQKYGETPESVGEKLDLDENVWRGIVKGKLYPEKCTVMAIALGCRMRPDDANSLFSQCGFSLSAESVRDVVFEYLITQRIFNAEMRDRCLAEYAIETIPVKREGVDRSPPEA